MCRLNRMHWKRLESSPVGGYGLCSQWGQWWSEFHSCNQQNLFCHTRRADVFVINIFHVIGERTLIVTEQRPMGWTDFKKKYQIQTPHNGMPWKSISRSISRVYIMSKQRIWSTGIIAAWTLAIYICPEWMPKAPLMFKIPAPPHHPGSLCYHLLWWTICWSHYRWWFRICCRINKLHIQPRNPAWTWRAKSSTAWWSHISIMYIFYVKFIQCSPVYWVHQSTKVFRYIW